MSLYAGVFSTGGKGGGNLSPLQISKLMCIALLKITYTWSCHLYTCAIMAQPKPNFTPPPFKKFLEKSLVCTHSETLPSHFSLPKINGCSNVLDQQLWFVFINF